MTDPKKSNEVAITSNEPKITPAPKPIPTPEYLRKIYWWAYEHPLAVKFWDRGFLINLILLGNYDALGNAVIEAFPKPLSGSTLQISCAYGKLTPRLQQQLADDGRLDLIDVLQIQLDNVKRKLQLPDDRMTFTQCDATALACEDGSYDRALMFFLPHELPEDERRLAISEAFRAVKPGGQLIFVEFHNPNWWHPLRLYQRLVFFLFEPFATDMWKHELTHYFPEDVAYTVESKTTYFGNLYQRIVVRKAPLIADK